MNTNFARQCSITGEGMKIHMELKNMTLEEFTDKVRDTVLDALDSLVDGKGWIDADLANLFKAIDKHAETLYERGLK
jgi:hypothetical protein